MGRIKSLGLFLVDWFFLGLLGFAFYRELKEFSVRVSALHGACRNESAFFEDVFTKGNIVRCCAAEQKGVVCENATRDA